MNIAQAESETPSASANRWITEYGDVLYGYAFARVRDPHLAEDLVQETLLVAMTSLSSFARVSSERTWLIGILKHKLVDHLRKAIRQHPLTDMQSDDASDPFEKNGQWKVRISQWPGDPHAVAENKEFQNVLAACMSKLPARTAQVFWFHEAESMTSKDLCKELGISSTNLWTMLHRARVHLQRCLTVNWFERDGTA